MNINKIKALFIYVGFLDKCKTILPFVSSGDYFCSLDFHKQTPSSRPICSFIWYEWEWRTNRGHLFLQMLFCNDLTSFCHSVDEKWLLGSCTQDFTVWNGEYGCMMLQLRLKNHLIHCFFVFFKFLFTLYSDDCFAQFSLDHRRYLGSTTGCTQGCRKLRRDKNFSVWEQICSFIGCRSFHWTFKWHPQKHIRVACSGKPTSRVTWYTVVSSEFFCYAYF